MYTAEWPHFCDPIDLTSIFDSWHPGGRLPVDVRFIKTGSLLDGGESFEGVTFLFGMGLLDLLEVDAAKLGPSQIVIVNGGDYVLTAMRQLLEEGHFDRLLADVRRHLPKVSMLDIETRRFFPPPKKQLLELHFSKGYVFRLRTISGNEHLPHMQRIMQDWEIRRWTADELQRELIVHLAELEHTPMAPAVKKSACEDAFHGKHAGDQRLLAALRDTVIGDEIRQYPLHHAAAIVFLSELANFEVHRGHANRYLAVMGCDPTKPIQERTVRGSSLLYRNAKDSSIRVGDMSDADWQDLRARSAGLYLRTRYKIPADFLIAALDSVPDLDNWAQVEQTGIAMLAGLLVDESALQTFEQYRHAHALLEGALYHATLYQGRATGDRVKLAHAMQHASNALALARPEERSHHANYWVGAALSKIVLSLDSARPALVDDSMYRRIVDILEPYPDALRQTQHTKLPDFYQLLFFAIGWATEAILGTDDTRKLNRVAADTNLVEEVLATLTNRFGKNHGAEGQYALHTATGYIALAACTHGLDSESLTAPLDAAIAYARKLRDLDSAPIVQLVEVRIRLLYLVHAKLSTDERRNEAVAALNILEAVTSEGIYSKLKGALKGCSDTGVLPAPSETLELSLTLPY